MGSDSPIDLLRARLARHDVVFSAEALLDREPARVDCDWWEPNGNRIYVGEGAVAPQLLCHPGLPPPRHAVVAVSAGCTVPSLVLWGDRPIVCVGRDVVLPDAYIVCGDASAIVINAGVAASAQCRLDARNGGLIFVGEEGLWADGIKIFTDDMHAIRDARSGTRINPRGGQIIVERHVWLGFEAMILRSARVGHDSVLGARSLAMGSLPPHCVSSGSPARPRRSGITWSWDDLPAS